ncbi:hypothetical protein [Lentibacillus sediminis]|uniref:hypothetical protein n=1 Tax=Lentibacillus sediminis TaxID=1940529 RepID=UPI000C1C0398|nr:hypothetical protein [Lentibacillus sediminis]
MNKNKAEALMWGIALPGVAQLLNKKYLKGTVLIFLELMINVMSNLNMAIVYSFQGDIPKSISATDYQWLMFYPCVYLFAIWDAYRDAGGAQSRFSFLPFVFAAYVSTIGVIYSSTFNVAGVYIGPVFLPILFIFIGLLLGRLIEMMVKARGE